MRALAFAAAFLAPASAFAAEPELVRGNLWPRDTAIVRPQGSGSTGMFAAFWHAAHPYVEVGSSFASTLTLAPNLRTRVKIGERGHWFAATEIALGSTSPLEHALQGFINPSNAVGHAPLGVRLVPSTALIGTFATAHTALTLRLEAFFGVPLDDRPFAGPLGTYAPVELYFAPSRTGARSHARLLFDQRLAAWSRIRAGASVDYIAQGSTGASPWFASIELQFEFAITRGARLVIGAQYWNFDQRQKTNVPVQYCQGQTCWDGVKSVFVRSHDVFPTADIVWSWPVEKKKTPPKAERPERK